MREHILIRAHPDYPAWMGRLSMSIAANAPRVKDEHVREDLERTLEEFLASGVPSRDLRDMLKEAHK